VEPDELCRLLGLPPEVSIATASRAYGERRDKLLAADADRSRAEVRHLDDAFFAFREQRGALARFADYCRARVRVGIGGETVLVLPNPDVARHGNFPFDAELVHILTACNPGNQHLDSRTNLQRQTELVDDLERRGLQCWPAIGGNESGSHEEVSVACAGLTDHDAKLLGGRWGQDAIFRWTPEQWTVLPCGGSEPQPLGWTSQRLSEPVPDPITEYRAARRRRERNTKAKRRSRAREAAGHAQRVEAGWPNRWRPRHIERWEEAGGDAHSARKFDDAGWLPQEVIGLANATDAAVASLRPPEGPAGQHRFLGDGLIELGTGEWPAAPPGTMLSVKHRWSSGRRERWAVVMTGQALIVHKFDRGRGGEWRRRDERIDSKGLVETVAGIPGLRDLKRGTVTEYTVDPRWVQPTLLLGALRASPAGGAEAGEDWPTDVAELWTDSDEQLAQLFGDVKWIPRWASLNGDRLAAIDTGSARRPTLSVVLFDESEQQIVPLREFARSSWFSEGDGAPISWDGGNSLSLAGVGLAYDKQWGDEGEEQSLVGLPRSPRGLAEALAEWVLRIEAEVAAAFALEPFDPKGTLSESQRQVWDERLDEVTISIEMDLSEEEISQVRRRLLRTGPVYRQTRDAFAHPSGRNGLALGATLDAVISDGVIGLLVSGEWEDRGATT
jgi:Protein of unknown function (DUF3293)